MAAAVEWTGRLGADRARHARGDRIPPRTNRHRHCRHVHGSPRNLCAVCCLLQQRFSDDRVVPHVADCGAHDDHLARLRFHNSVRRVPRAIAPQEPVDYCRCVSAPDWRRRSRVRLAHHSWTEWHSEQHARESRNSSASHWNCCTRKGPSSSGWSISSCLL